MSLFAATALIGGGVAKALDTHDKQKKENTKQDLLMKFPDKGVYLSPTVSRDLARTGVAYRIIPDVDLRGVPFWHIDYGNGSLARTYAPPHLIGISHARAATK